MITNKQVLNNARCFATVPGSKFVGSEWAGARSEAARYHHGLLSVPGRILSHHFSMGRDILLQTMLCVSVPGSSV